MAKKSNAGSPIGVGVGMAAAAAAAAGGAYWLYGAKHSSKHRKIAKSWMLKARAEVMDAVEKLEDVDKEKYMQIAEGVVKNYTAKGASQDEIVRVMKDFKAAWSHMQGPKKAAKKAKGVAKKAVKKVVKKATTSASKK